MKTKKQKTKKQKAKAKFIPNSLLNSLHHRDQSLMHECQIQVINLLIITAWSLYCLMWDLYQSSVYHQIIKQ